MELSRSESEDLGGLNIERLKFKGKLYALLVFINGNFSEEFSFYPEGDNGIQVKQLQKAFVEDEELVEKYLSKQADWQNNALVALNTSLTSNGAFISIADGRSYENPIQILHISTDQSFLTNHRNLIVVGENSQAEIIESYYGKDDVTGFNNVVTEFVFRENSIVDHYKIQAEGSGTYHVAFNQVNQEKGSTYTSFNLDLGGKLTRNDLNSYLNGEHCETNFYGLYVGDGEQHFDNHTRIDHASPNCNSNEHYKGILADKSRGVFNGKVLVHKDAQKTNAYQSNNNILLSEKATINTKPELEIYADDVKCSHGATIGELDEEALFYLRTRGIGEEQASRILRFAFVGEVIEKIKEQPIRERIESLVRKKFRGQL